MARPEWYRDKSVKVEGKVVAMCGHRRGWFAIADSDPQNPPLRILTAPAFLVPVDAMGQRAIAEGIIEVREISEQAANHLAQGHGLPKNRKVILMQAKGARFE
jgi:hypothetical protein